MNVYQSCPSFYTPGFHIRLVRMEDAPGLLRVYSDAQAQPYFNADNCTSDFRYRTLEQMEGCIRMWLDSYAAGYFVRWVILERGSPVGTVEMFRRDDGRDGKGCGVLRMDLGREQEFENVFDELLHSMLQPLHELFGCAEILTKAPSFARQRRTMLQAHGFRPAPKAVRRADGTFYEDYFSHRA